MHGSMKFYFYQDTDKTELFMILIKSSAQITCPILPFFSFVILLMKKMTDSFRLVLIDNKDQSPLFLKVKQKSLLMSRPFMENWTKIQPD